MSRPVNVRNPFDWKRTIVEDQLAIGAIDKATARAWHRVIDEDEVADRRQGEAELASLRQREMERPWWKRWFW